MAYLPTNQTDFVLYKLFCRKYFAKGMYSSRFSTAVGVTVKACTSMASDYIAEPCFLYPLYHSSNTLMNMLIPSCRITQSKSSGMVVEMAYGSSIFSALTFVLRPPSHQNGSTPCLSCLCHHLQPCRTGWGGQHKARRTQTRRRFRISSASDLSTPSIEAGTLGWAHFASSLALHMWPGSKKQMWGQNLDDW